MDSNGYRIRQSKKERGNEFAGTISPQPDRKIPTASGESWHKPAKRPAEIVPVAPKSRHQ